VSGAGRVGTSHILASAPAARSAAQRVGMVRTFTSTLAKEGLPAMYSGLPAAALRQFVYGGLGIGLYAPVRALVIGKDVDPKDAPLWKRILAGAITGAGGGEWRLSCP
jgi:hypothetical protein